MIGCGICQGNGLDRWYWDYEREPEYMQGAEQFEEDRRQHVRQQEISAYLMDLESVFGLDRLNAYQSPNHDNLDTITTYFWNIALSRDLHLSLSAAEVSMRNGIHAALTHHAKQPNWYDLIPLLPYEVISIREAKKSIRKGKKKVIPGRVISELHFGFWTTLLSAGFGPNGYGSTIWSPNNAACVVRAFPHLEPANQHRSFVHGRFNKIRLLRNRTNHHEPVWRGLTLPDGTSLALQDIYSDIIESIGWVSPRLRDSVIAFDCFPETLASGWAMQKKQIEDYLGI